MKTSKKQKLASQHKQRIIIFIMYIIFILIFSFLIFHLCHAAIFDIVNQCPYTIWPAIIPGGGRELLPGQNWTIFVNSRMDDARIWARTGCTFNKSGHGQCETGDCNGLLECQIYGSPPNTLAEFTLNGFNNLDFISISLVEGFNVPIEFSPIAGCNHAIQCSTNITGQCPDELKTSGGCNNPCTVFKTDEYCCKSGNCKPTNYSNFFKGLCPNAYSYPMDDESSTFTCIGGTDYRIAFCPNNIVTTPPSSSGYATFDIINRCPYTVWAAAIPGGGKQLDKDQTWSINVNVGTVPGRIWARTGCNFSDSGYGSCETGDCNGLLECQAYGKPPNTLAEFALNQFSNLDFNDISLVEGFNVPMEFSPTSGCARGMIQCSADINGQCPAQLKTNGGCNNPCTVFKTNEYCCNSGSCGPTNYSKFFKGFCPNAYSYPYDDKTSTFTCPGGASYKVVFCP
ncbi:Thaumatin family protein [Dioscorea alata]|uniref:Thaumatin family protein n=1 Tax=Dioscorea alata TaxID=55571 RepID=A0ACB7TNH1_DIOAL|nr:Thaumatin family protein [Dioscorea alata]